MRGALSAISAAMKSVARAGASPSPQVAAITSSRSVRARSEGVASAASSTRGAKPSRWASLLALRARASELPDSVANRMVSAGRATGAAMGAATGAPAAS